MKCIKFYLVALLCVVLASCQPRYTHNDIILRAETLLNSKPDSAQKLLVSISHPEKLPAADYAAWCLQYTHSQYKLYQDIKSDSIIRKAVKYYDNSKLYKQNGTAYYLLGCILQQKNKNKAAMWAYKKADEALKNTTENDLIGLVKFEIGYIYMIDEIYGQALSFFNKSLKYFIRSKNISYQAYAYREISDMYVRLNYSTKDILRFSNLALRLAYQSGDSLNYYSVLAQQGELLMDNDYNRSKDYLLKGYWYFPSQRPNYATLIALDYAQLNKFDSAKHYLQISLAGTLELKFRIRRYLVEAYIAKDEGNLKIAFDNVIRAYNVRDSVFQQTLHSQIYRIDKQFDLTQKDKENAALKIANQRKVIFITLLIIAVLAVFVFLLVLNNRHKRKQSQHTLEQQRLDFELKTKEAEHVNEKQRLGFELKAKSAENEQKRALLMSKLQNRIGNTLRFNRLQMELMQHEKLEAFMTEITKQAVIAEKEWQYYIGEVNQLFDGIIARLQEQYTDLTQPDLIVIALICLKVDVSDCCNLLNMHKNTMYTRRKTIKKRLGIEKDIDLEEWLLAAVSSKQLSVNSYQ